MITFSKKERL